MSDTKMPSTSKEATAVGNDDDCEGTAASERGRQFSQVQFMLCGGRPSELIAWCLFSTVRACLGYAAKHV